MVYCGIFLHHVQHLGIEIIQVSDLPQNVQAIYLYASHPIIKLSCEATEKTIDSAIALIVEKMADKPRETSDSWRPESSR